MLARNVEADVSVIGLVGERGREVQGRFAERGRYPAINILRSVSRTMPKAADQAFLPGLTHARQLMVTYADTEELHGPPEEFLGQAKDELPVLGRAISALRKFCESRKPKNNVGLSSSWIAWTAVVAGYGNKRNRGPSQAGTSGEYESMKSRETLIRLKKFQVDEKRRRVAQIEGMIAEFDRMAVDLEREIKTEQDRAGIHDPAHFAYPTYAKAAMNRRDNLKRSADELRVQLEDAKALLGEAFEEMKKVELLDERDQMREREEVEAREQAELDAIGLLRSTARA